MSTRGDILNNLAGRLSSIAPAAGWGSRPLQITSLPQIAWRDTVELEKDSIIGLPRLYKMRVAIAGYVSGSAGSARSILEQIVAAVGTDPRCGDLAERTTPLSFQLKASQAADVTACGVMTLDIWYRSALTETAPADGDYLIDENGNILTDEAGDRMTW